MNRAAFALPLALITAVSLVACSDDDADNAAAPTFSQSQTTGSTPPEETTSSAPTTTSAADTPESSESSENAEPAANPANVLGPNPEAATAAQCRKDSPYNRSLEKTFGRIEQQDWGNSIRMREPVFEVGYCNENWVEFSADGKSFQHEPVAMTFVYPWSKTSEEVGSRYGNLPYEQVAVEGPLDYQICWKETELRDAGVPDDALDLLDLCPAS